MLASSSRPRTPRIAIVDISMGRHATSPSYSIPQEHNDFFANDPALGPLVLSVRMETISSQDHFRIMLRTRQGTVHEIVPGSGLCPCGRRLLCSLRAALGFVHGPSALRRSDHGTLHAHRFPRRNRDDSSVRRPTRRRCVSDTTSMSSRIPTNSASFCNALDRRRRRNSSGTSPRVRPSRSSSP